MSESSKYNNQFNFNDKVGNVNTGDTKIEGDQIGIQHNYPSEKTLADSVKEIQDLLNQLSQGNSRITEIEQQEFIDTWTQTVEDYPIQTETEQQNFVTQFNQKIIKNPRIRKVLLAGGIELVKILCPPVSIPIEMRKTWLETAKNNQ